VAPPESGIPRAAATRGNDRVTSTINPSSIDPCSAMALGGVTIGPFWEGGERFRSRRGPRSRSSLDQRNSQSVIFVGAAAHLLPVSVPLTILAEHVP
jgi:hypothetical protein